MPGFRSAPGDGDRCGAVCRWKYRRHILRGHAAVSASARRPGGWTDRGRATGLPVAPSRLRRRGRADGPRTPTDFRQDPRTRSDVHEADESLASETRHRIGVRQRHRRRIAGAPARFAGATPPSSNAPETATAPPGSNPSPTTNTRRKPAIGAESYGARHNRFGPTPDALPHLRG